MTYKITALLLFSQSFNAFAVPPPSPLPQEVVGFKRAASPEGSLPLDVLQQKLYKTSQSKKARKLKQAYDALKKNNTSSAIALSASAQEDPVFSDYGFWISASALRQQASNAYSKKSYDSAISLARKALQQSLQIESKTPYSPFIKGLPRDLATAELTLGSGYWGKKKWVQAQQNFENAFQRLQTQNLLMLVKPEYLGQYGESCKKKPGVLCLGWLQKFSVLFVRKSEEMKAISEFYTPIPEKPRVPKPSNRVAISYKSTDNDQLAYDAAMKYYFDGKYSQTIKSLWQFLDDFPRSVHRYRARYWLAQALTHEQEHEKAQKLYDDLQVDTPLSYYGLLAASASGKPFDSFVDTGTPMALDTDTDLSPQEIFHLGRAKNFIAEKAYDLAAFELRDLKARDVLSNAFLVYLAMLNYTSKNYNNCFQLLGELIQRGYDGIFSGYAMKMIFPVDFIELIRKYSQDNNLDPILVLSLIKQESAFDEDINSPSGALGLMQLMPGTAADMDPEISTSELLSADPNIRVGTKYLHKLLTRFNGNIVLALASYNAGPNATDRWVRDTQPSKLGMLEFIESIPYKETREYVAGIVRNYFWYSRLLNGMSPTSGLAYFWNVYGPPENHGQSPTPAPAPLISPPAPVNETGAKTKPRNGSA